MDWKLFATTYAAVFVAELGDKTQLATFSFAAGGSSRWAVFLGAAAALVSTSAVAVLAADAVARVVPAGWAERAAGLLFLAIGVVMLVNTHRGG